MFSQLKTRIRTQPRAPIPGVRQVTAVYCDFDGTITCVDATDAVLEAFALPAWRDWEQRWVDGEITSQACLAQQVQLIKADRNTLAAFAAHLPIDDGIVDLARRCQEHGVQLTVVSDGLDFIIESVLRRHGLIHLPVYSNHLRWGEGGGLELSFPFAAKGCESGAGTCKCVLTGQLQPSPGAVYIGDGRSDRCVSAKIQRVFAKANLLEWCTTQGIACEPFESLHEVAVRLFPKEAV